MFTVSLTTPCVCAFHQLLEMSAELEALGGGDARIGRTQVYCRICPPPLCGTNETDAVVSYGAGHIAVRDPSCPSEMCPAAQSVRRFKVTSPLPPDCRQSSLFEGGREGGAEGGLGREALEWFVDGFNASIVAFGQTGTGKTYSLYGSGGHSSLCDSDEQVCEIRNMLVVFASALCTQLM
jgi:hypothetical protein